MLICNCKTRSTGPLAPPEAPPPAPTTTAKPSALASPAITPARRPDPPAAKVTRPKTEHRALIQVRERFAGETISSVRFPPTGREWIFLCGPHFDIEHGPQRGGCWYITYLRSLLTEIDALAHKSGFDEFIFEVDLPHCRERETWSTQHDYPIS